MLQATLLRAVAKSKRLRQKEKQQKEAKSATPGNKRSSTGNMGQEGSSEDMQESEKETSDDSSDSGDVSLSDLGGQEDSHVPSPSASPAADLDLDPSGVGASATTAPSAAAPAAMPAAPTARPTAAVGGAVPGRSWQRRGERWGIFTISPIVRSRDGRVTGYGAICGMHTDADTPARLQCQCKKATAWRETSDISRDEVRVRLKRWLLAGILSQHEWPLHQLRTSHVQLQLSELSTGPTEPEMDAFMERFAQHE